MTKEERINKIAELKKVASKLKKEVDYYNSLQLALKLVLNGSYGAYASAYFILFNEYVAGTITAQGRDLTRKMDIVNVDYWMKQWHVDYELHNRMCIRDVKQIMDAIKTSTYADTDSIFVSFDEAINNCNWQNLFFNDEYLSALNSNSLIISREDIKTQAVVYRIDGKRVSPLDIQNIKERLQDSDRVIIDGSLVKDYLLNSEILPLIDHVTWNWSSELDFIQGIDKFRYADYFRICLEKYAEEFGVENKQDFELERISESIINIAKKKYIQHIVFEDGIDYESMSYIFPKGVELVRSSTPAFAREKIVEIVKYLFAHPDDFNIKSLLRIVKELRKEFELSDVDDISMQTSCNKYDEKVLEDKERLLFVTGAHFSVKAAAYYNHLLYKNKEHQERYEFLKSGSKIKYYYCKNRRVNDIFAYTRGTFPVEFAPEIDYDEQFLKSILSPINSIIEPLGMPGITKRIKVVMSIFGQDF